MNEPRRLLDQSPDEFSHSLLRSWQTENPSPAAVSRTARAMGLSGASAAAVAFTTARAAASAGAARAAGGGVALVALKWGVVGLASGLLVAGAIATLEPAPQAPRELSTTVTVAGRADQGQKGQLGKRAQQVDAARTKDDSRNIRSNLALYSPSHGAAPAVETESSASLGRKRSRDSIADAIAALDRARTALARHDASAALADLALLSGLPGSETFAPEATLLRIQALAQTGQPQQARELARRFANDYPTSPSLGALQEWLDAP